MKSQRYFFEIGVYRTSENAYVTEVDDATERHLQWLYTQSGGVTRDQAPETYRNAEQYAWEECGGPWHYNQAIGWLRFYVLGSQIRGELFFVKAKRIQRFQKAKEFRYVGKVFELSFRRDASSAQIFERVRAVLKELGREPPFRKRHIDLEAFDNVGACIDWRKLIGFER